MSVWMAVLGGVLGAFIGGSGSVLLGAAAGVLLAAQQVRMTALLRRIEHLERRNVVPPEVAPARDMAPSEAPPPSPAVAAGPQAADMATDGARVALAISAAPVASTPETDRPDHRAPVEAADPSLENRVSAMLRRAAETARGWLFGGNLPVKIGVLVLLFGVAAALKYSMDAGWLRAPISLRLALIAAGGLAAVIWGWRNRELRPAFGLSLQGGGIGVLLLTVFAAYRLYQLLPAGVAFALVLVLVAGAAALAVLQQAMSLAVLGFLGGYLAPVLLSTGEGSHVTLFSFYALLNFFVFAIAWSRHWRGLNLIGFFFTFVIGLSWGAQYYQPEHFATVEPFLILFFLFFVAIAMLHALRAPEERRGFIDRTLLFGTPLLTFALQAAMLHDNALALAWSALGMAGLYAVLAYWLLRRRQPLLLGQSLGVLAVGFATLAIPLAFSARWTCTVWALEGVGLVWLGLRQRQLLPQIVGIVLQGLAAISYITSLMYEAGWRAAPDEWLLVNGHALCLLLLSASAFAVSWLFERAGKGRLWVWPGFLLGLGWWGLLGIREVEQNAASLLIHKTTILTVSGWVGFAALSLLLMAGLRRILAWPRLGWGVLLVLMLSVPLALASQPQALSALHWPLAGFWLAWLVAAVFALAALRTPKQKGLGVAHVLFLTTLSLAYGAGFFRLAVGFGMGEDWRFVVALLPLTALLCLTWRWPAVGARPLVREFPAHAGYWFALAGIALGLAWLESLALGGDTAPLPYVPLVNPAELFQLAGLIVLARWVKRQAHEPGAALLAAAIIVFLSMAGLRAVHHYAELPWSTSILMHGTAQTTLTVLWCLVGVYAWVAGSRRGRWSLWLVGAIALGAVLLKLVLLDRQYVGNLAGIVSFIAVGGLLVLVGRVAPTPPRQSERKGGS